MPKREREINRFGARLQLNNLPPGSIEQHSKTIPFYYGNMDERYNLNSNNNERCATHKKKDRQLDCCDRNKKKAAAKLYNNNSKFKAKMNKS